MLLSVCFLACFSRHSEVTKSRYVSWYVGKIAAQKVRNNGAVCNAGSQSDSVEVVTGCPFKNRTAREAERLRWKTKQFGQKCPAAVSRL